MFALTMHVPTPAKVPTLLAFMTACCALIVVAFITVAAQAPAPAPDALSISKELFLWIVAASGFISLFFAIGYGFFKKQKYENLEKDRDEWKGIAEGREERIKELKYTQSEAVAKLELKVQAKDSELTNIKESNGALVSQGLQMKAILRGLRLTGVWQGHEERIHEAQNDERR